MRLCWARKKTTPRSATVGICEYYGLREGVVVVRDGVCTEDGEVTNTLFGIRGIENVVDDVAAVFGEFGADDGGDEDGVEGVEGAGGVDAWVGHCRYTVVFSVYC